MPATLHRRHQDNPTVRVYHSTPSPESQKGSSDQSMLAQSPFVGSGWDSERFPGAGYLNAHARNISSPQTIHKRKSSGSSVTSGGPPSPLNYSTAFPHIANSDSSHLSPASYDNFDYMSTPLSSATSKSLPASADIPTSASFMPMGYQNLGQDANVYTATDMRRIQSSGADDQAHYAFSAPQSVSSMSHNSPATPHTNYEVEYEDAKNMYSGFPTSAAYNQALQEVFPEQAFTAPTAQYVAQQPMPRYNNNHLSPHHTMFASRLQAANQDHLALRTNSPVTSAPRVNSPFRRDSPYIEQMRRTNVRAPQQMTAMQPPPPQEAPRASVSPKELLLDEHDVDEAETPLFPGKSNPLFSVRREDSDMSTFQTGLYATAYGHAPSVHIPQQYPFVSHASRQDNSQQSVPDQTPDFPAHIASMESTVEEGQSEPSSQTTAPHQPLTRPEDTTSGGGTYTCTYHGCVQRFETPAKLQKHKREAHRQVSPSSASPHTTQSLALRNSQAGPHKCERINPSTGKPCNSIFSRPYDLTRHEDTIHNARKQKVRCHLCTEEKTFSRNDALTRHMRVVHPDVDWPGKTKRKNGKD